MMLNLRFSAPARCAAPLMILAALAGCADRFDHIGKAPTMSPVTTPRHPIDPSSVSMRRQPPQVPQGLRPKDMLMRPYDHPQTPPPGVAPHGAAIGPHGRYDPDAIQTSAIPGYGLRRPRDGDSASLWSAGPRSLFGDRRAQTVGDIVTVLIEIEDEASISNTTTRTRTGSEELEIPNLLGAGSIADRIFPGADVLNPAVSLDSSSSSNGAGSVSRNESVDLRVAATVIDVLPNGHLLVTGNQEVRVNFELRDLQVAGVIRPEDISRRNTITYDKIANARISYGGRGQISDLQQPRIGQQVLDAVSPF